ncbi:MAG: four-carbon acid sugar kinase family protein [Pirellulaceae bacterium]
MLQDGRATIFADDLTGACDVSLPFHTTGLSCFVSIGAPLLGHPSTDVCIIDMETRNLDSNNSYGQAFAHTQRLKLDGGRLAYLKMDSTWEGNVGHELRAIHDNRIVDLAIVAPAFPKMGRSVFNGQLLIRGKSDSQFLQEKLRHQGIQTLSHITTRQLEMTVEDLLDWVVSLHAQGTNTITCDATCDEELSTIALLIDKLESVHGLSVLPVGSAGLADHIIGDQTDSDSKRLSVAPSSVIAIIGSENKITHDQLDVALRDDLLDELENSRDGMRICRLRCHTGKHSVIKMNWEAKMESMLAEAMESWMASTNCILFCSGGDTAKRVCEIAQAEGVHVLDQVAPGIAAGTIHGGLLNGIQLITKAGGFGPRDTISRILQSFNQRMVA